jgi:hypothetical protein
MKRHWLGLALLGLMGLSTSAGAVDAEAQKVLDCMRKNIPQSLRVQEFDLTSADRTGGTRTLRGKLFAKREDNLLRAMVKIKSPPDLSGAAYLVREGKEKDDMYVFVPALNKVRRISGANTDGPLFGTDFSYTDIKQMQNAAEGGDTTLEKPDKIDGRDVTVLRVAPKPGTPSRYSLIRSWIDQKGCVPLKIEFSEGSTVRKRLTAPASAIAQSGAIWYLAEAKMSDLRDNTYTILKITGLASDVKISDRYFNSATFANAD